MALLDGKQLKNSSTSLNKLSGTGVVTFTSANMTYTTATVSFGTQSVLTLDRQATQFGLDGNQIVNKYYVDSVAAGFDPKEAVVVAATGSININSGPALIDGVTMSIGDRVLLWQQSSNLDNGIYNWMGLGATMTRSYDMDGTPASEVSTGNYTFVSNGDTNKGFGFVVVSPGTHSGVLLLGTHSIIWTQFSGPGSLVWGRGLYQNGVNKIEIELASNSGLEFDSSLDSGRLRIADTIAGKGLTMSNGSINIELDTNSGLEISPNDATGKLRIADATAGNGLTFSGGAFAINTTNGLSIISDSVGLGGTLTQATTITGASFDLSMSGLGTLTLGSATLSVSVTTGQVTTADSQGLKYTADYTGTFVTHSLVTKGYVDSVVSAVGATNGLTEFSNGIVGFGGTMGQNTTLHGSTSTYSLHFNNIGNFQIDAEAFDFTSLDSTGFVNIDAGIQGTMQLLSGDLTMYADGDTLLGGTGSVDIRKFSTGTLSVVSDNGLVLSFSNSVVTDISGASHGLVYAANYTAGFVTHSLVTKGYVDSIVSAVGATNGLTEFSSGIVGLGGTLSQNTTINGNSNNLVLKTSVLGGENNIILKDGTNGDTLSLTTDGTSYNQSWITLGTNSVSVAYGSGDSNLDISNNLVNLVTGGNFTLNFSASTVTDISGASQGLVYAADYSAGFVNNSLITKQYVDTQIASIASEPTTANKNMTPTAASTQGSPTGLYPTYVPANDSYVMVSINGQSQFVGSGATTSCDCYFSTDGGTTAVTIANIGTASQLMWNATDAGFALTTSDRVDFFYNVA